MNPTLKVALGAVTISFAPILMRLSGFHPTWAAFFRVGIAALVLLPFVLRDFRPRQLSKRQVLAILVGGLIFSLDLSTWHHSIYLVGAGLATILGNGQVFILTAYGMWRHRERPSGRFFLALLLAVIGLILLVDMDEVRSQAGAGYLLGLFLGILTACFYAGYIICLRAGGTTRLPTRHLLFGVSLVSSFGLAGIGSLEQFPPILPADGWVYIIILALAVQVGAWLLITSSLPHVPISRTGLLLLLQPALSFIWGILILHEPFDLKRGLGACVCILAIYLGGALGSRLTPRP